MEAYVPAILVNYVSLFASHFTKPSFAYFGGYLLSLLITRGRKTMSRVSHTCFFVDRHLSSWERFLSENHWDLNEVLKTVTQLVVAQMGDALKVHGAFLAALDPTLIAKGGKRMPGVQKWKDHSGNADRGVSIKGHHWALLGLISFSAKLGRYICFPLLMEMISGQLNPCKICVDPQGVATIASIWDCVHPLIWQLQSFLGEKVPLRVVDDAYFSKAPFVNPLVEVGINVVSKLRKDAVGWDDPSSEQRSDAKRGKEWKLADLLDKLPTTIFTVHLYGKKVKVRAISRVVQLRNFNKKVKVVVVEGIKTPIILFSTDLALTAAPIIEIYGARFSIELAIRDLKQNFGLGDYQCYTGTAIHRFVNLACTVFCVFRLILLREDNSDWLPPVPDGTSPASFNFLRKGLQHHIIRRILVGHLPCLCPLLPRKKRACSWQMPY